MKKRVLFGFLLVSICAAAFDATMYKWQSYLAYGSTETVVEADDKVYGLAGGALFSIDKSTDEIEPLSKQDGLNGSEIAKIAYDKTSRTLVIVYVDGLIDLMHQNKVESIIDLQRKLLSASKKANQIEFDKQIAYLCMPFGIVLVDTKNKQIKDTYFIGDEGANVDVLDMAIGQDSLYAISNDKIYSVSQKDNKMDFRYWHRSQPTTQGAAYSAIEIWNNEPIVVANHSIWYRQNGVWNKLNTDQTVRNIKVCNQRLYVFTSSNGIYSLSDTYQLLREESPYTVQDIIANGNVYWMAVDVDGIVRQTPDETQSFSVNGPLVNMPYRIRICNDKLIMVPGGYYVEQTYTPGCVMIYENGMWNNIGYQQLYQETGKFEYVRNFSDAIIDPYNPSHYYVASFESGLYEFLNDHLVHWYHSDSKTIQNIIEPGIVYSFADGFAYDSQHNLWMINLCGNKNIKVIMNDGRWVGLKHDVTLQMSRARDLLIWNQNENIKLIGCHHPTPGIVVIDDNGTIENTADDRTAFCSEFVDQDGNTIRLEKLHSITQNKDGALWIGTQAGIIVVDNPSQLLTGNACRKIKIPRNDGTNLADYLLNAEQINAMAVDGSNRVWIGTAASGLFLVSPDGIETIYHFTSENSPLLDNSIVSLAINSNTGCVYIGTSKGLISFQSDASPASPDYQEVYAYPNPVRDDYDGVITLRGLMDDSDVNIIDESGNVVYKTRSNGGIAVWDGRMADGQRASSGVYTVLLNEASQGKHAVTKILFVNGKQ